MKKTLPTISVVLFTSKVYTNGEHPIMLRVTYNNQRKYKSLGYSCTAKEWNDKKHEVRGSHPNSANINKLIRKEVRKAEDAATALEASGAVYSAQSILNATSRPKITIKTLFGLFDERVTYFKKQKQKYNTATGYKTLLNIIKRYTNDTDIELIDVGGEWIHDFEVHLLTKYKDTSIKKYFDCLRAAFKEAVRKEYITKSPLDGYKHVRKLDPKTSKRALELHQLSALYSYYIETYGRAGNKTTDLEVCKKHYWNKKFQRRGTTKLTPIDAEQLSLCLFFCSYFMQGLALVDLAKLKWKDFHDYEVVDKEKFLSDTALYGSKYAQEHKVTSDYYRIDISRTKTTKPVRIIVEEGVLTPFLLPFTKDFKGLTDEEQDNKYVFPIFSEADNTAQKQFGRMTYANYLVNNNLKRVGEKLGINGITFYSARHSYASNLRHNRVDIGLIAQNMGRNVEDIETYLKEFDEDDIIQANELTYITGQPEYKEAAKKKPINAKLKELFEKRAAEEEKLLEQYGGVEAYNAMIKKKQEDLKAKLEEMFGDDIDAKFQYLKSLP